MYKRQGSTAYAFSARGPIVDSSHHSIQVTPVSPHMLFDRTLVLEPSPQLELQILGDRTATCTVDGREMGVFMVLMAILGGKGTLWGPVIGATLFHLFKEGFWTLFLGWQYVALGVLIVVIVIYFPEGLMGWLREKYPERFGEVIDEKDRKASVELK